MSSTSTANTVESELHFAKELLANGRKVVVATVIKTWGSSPRPAGSHLVIDDQGNFQGSVSGGCIEGAVVQEAQRVIEDGIHKILEFGVSQEQAWEVGLSCGGAIQILLTPVYKTVLLDRIISVYGEAFVALATDLHSGKQAVIDSMGTCGDLTLNKQLRDELHSMEIDNRSGMSTHDNVFFRIYAPKTKLLIIGAVHIAQFLAPIAEIAGFSVSIIDPRRAFASDTRFSNIEVIHAWPDDAMSEMSITSRTAIVTLTHDPKLDDPALKIGLKSAAFYIGSLGSKRTHAQRLERLSGEGLKEEAARIHAPVGLNLGGRAPQEIAVAILAEILQSKYKKRSTD